MCQMVGFVSRVVEKRQVSEWEGRDCSEVSERLSEVWWVRRERQLPTHLRLTTRPG